MPPVSCTFTPLIDIKEKAFHKISKMEEASRKGDVAAQYCLGLHYLKGKIVEKDLWEAKRFFKLAASQGHLEAIKVLAALKNSRLPNL